jgi:flavin-dependent dehydrogenase
VDNVKFSDKNVITTISSENNSSEIHSKYIIDGSGYGRVLPRLLDLDAPSSLPPRAAIFTHIIDNNRPNDVDGNRIQAIVIKKDLWAWVIPFSNGKTSVGIVGDIQNLTDKNKSNEANFKELLKLNKFLKSRIGESSFVFEPRMITAYSSSVKKFNGDRFVLTGNSTEFLDPIFSSGVTFALESGVKAANLVDRELQGKKVDWEKEYVTYIQQGVDVFRSYINDWYNGNLHTVFFSDNIDQNFKEQICSVLAGYVWDHNNPFVKKHKKIIKNLAKVIEITQ